MADKTRTPDVEEEYWQEVTYICPTRGKVTQKVKVTKYRAQKAPDKPEFELEILKTLEDDSDV